MFNIWVHKSGSREQWDLDSHPFLQENVQLLTIVRVNGQKDEDTLTVIESKINQWILVPGKRSANVLLQCDGARHKSIKLTDTEIWWVHPKCVLSTTNITTMSISSYKLDVVIDYDFPTVVNLSFMIDAEVRRN